jgi:hypothetical protein
MEDELNDAFLAFFTFEELSIRFLHTTDRVKKVSLLLRMRTLVRREMGYT